MQNKGIFFIFQNENQEKFAVAVQFFFVCSRNDKTTGTRAIMARPRLFYQE